MKSIKLWGDFSCSQIIPQAESALLAGLALEAHARAHGGRSSEGSGDPWIRQEAPALETLAKMPWPLLGTQVSLRKARPARRRAGLLRLFEDRAAGCGLQERPRCRAGTGMLLSGLRFQFGVSLTCGGDLCLRRRSEAGATPATLAKPSRIAARESCPRCRRSLRL